MTQNSVMDISVESLNQLTDSDGSVIVSLTLIGISFLNKNEE